MIFLALKTEDGRITGKIASYCRMLGISRQGFYKYLTNKDRPWKYQGLADAMKKIVNEDECNDTYGRIRMYQAMLLKQPEGGYIFPVSGPYTGLWIRLASAIGQRESRMGSQRQTGKP